MDNQRIEFTPEVIAQQRAICDAATPGPWAVSVANEYPYDDIGSGLTGEHVAICGSKNENTQFIITARTVLPAALDALEASMAREAEKDATIARCGRKVQFIAQQRDTWRKASERLADHEKDLQQTIARLTAERGAAVSDMFGCMSTQGQCVRCKKRYYCDGTDDDKFSPLCKNKSHCYAWEWRGLHADNTDAPTEDVQEDGK